MSKLQRVTSWVVGMCAVVGIAGSAWAAAYGSPGWNFGRNNCGPVGTPGSTTQSGCEKCCEEAECPSPTFTPCLEPSTEVNDCKAYCASVYLSGNPWVKPGGPNPYQ